jgi:hypothetical protein
MNENLLQYLWKYKIFSKIDFKDSEGNPLEILDFGRFNSNAGPDFSFAKIKIKDVILAGNIEIHVKSSDWYFHRHDSQKDYQSVILHVVYFNDTDVLEIKNAGIPTLELKDYIDEQILKKYQSLENHFELKLFDISNKNNQFDVYFHFKLLICLIFKIKTINLQSQLKTTTFLTYNNQLNIKINKSTITFVLTYIDEDNKEQIDTKELELSSYFSWLEDEDFIIKSPIRN